MVLKLPFMTGSTPDPLDGVAPGADQHGKSALSLRKGSDEEPDGKPIFLFVGSLSGASRKDAESYARGLADEMLKSVELGRVYVYDDKARGRMIYEIHEGGVQLSIAKKVADLLDVQDKVQIGLCNDVYVSIERTHDQIYTLLHNRDEESNILEDSDVRDIAEFVSETKLDEIYPDRNGLASLGGVLLGISLFAFLIAGALHLVVKSGITEADTLFAFASKGVVSDAGDNPAWQLDKARRAAEAEGKHIKTLRKDARGWNWEYQ